MTSGSPERKIAPARLPSTEEREQLGAVVAPEQALHFQANVGLGE